MFRARPDVGPALEAKENAMADYPPPATTASQPPITAALIVYALFAITAIGGVIGSGFVMFAPLFAILGIVGVIIAYV